ncbi:hypothetical protein [Sphingobium ummariense]|uniref:Uncharacterized protein n=1 Tax=Sphingobium ummariense RL-3 TaxID=1346791 RepID=T0IWW5_9SPHN|nr:hypothetical protein [Sphingobium ummariense]EQB33305.1 hypothetical protein M529_04885 [Sphingobium ummariense RL-3]
MANEQHQIIATDILFYHDSDERAFFEWIDRMSFVQESCGIGSDIFIRFNRFPTDDDLWELIGFCRRYQVEMTQLKKFLTDANREWFLNPEMFWFTQIFGSSEAANGS